MKISFLIPAVVFYVVEIAVSNSLQVGTVLFTTTDLVKKCWTESDKSLLKARLIMQDVLPDPDCIDFSKPEASVVLLDYFRACYQIISTSTYGKLQNLMYIALSDTLGGYLRAYVLPFARRAYYAGQLEYSEAKKLFQFYDDIRLFLKTSGIGWAEPMKVCFKRTRARPLVITGGSLDACAQLYTIEKDKLHCINPSKEKNRKCPLPSNPCNCRCRQGARHKRDSFDNSSTSDSTDHLRSSSSDTFPPNFKRSACARRCQKKTVKLDAKRVIIPLPVLDDCVSPNTIAVPFKKRPLRNLSSRSSAFILEYYYVAVVKCFFAKGNTRTDIKNFNAQFHYWLVTQVFPHLTDERWYPGFGGVLRVLETIRIFGAETTAQDSGMRDIGFMFGQGVSFEMNDDPKQSGKATVREIGECDDSECCTSRHYITLVLLGFLVLVFIFFAGGFFYMALRGRKPGPKPTGGSQKKPQVCDSSDNFINFQFLIKFFKKNTDTQPQAHTVQHVHVEKEDRKWKNAQQPAPVSRKEQAKKETHHGGDPWDRKYREMRRLVMTAQGDIASLGMVSNLETMEGSHVPECEVQLPYKDFRRGAGDARGVRVLWNKKRAARQEKRSGRNKDREKSKRGFKRSERNKTSTSDEDSYRKGSSYRKESSCSASVEDETKGSSREMRSSTSSYSDSSQQANTSSTDYSFSEAQESMGKSYTLGEDSFTNESDY